MNLKVMISVILFIAVSSFSLSQKSQSSEDIPVKQLATYKKGSMTWTNLLIPRKVSKERLIKLARELHKSEPNTSFRLFDDDKEFQQFKDWDVNYPNPAFKYPQKWVKEHHIANIQKMAYDASGPKWVLLEGYTTDKIADLDQ